jgi:hypothetical protein
MYSRRSVILPAVNTPARAPLVGPAKQEGTCLLSGDSSGAEPMDGRVKYSSNEECELSASNC